MIQISMCEKQVALDTLDYLMCFFNLTLSSISITPSNYVMTCQEAYIAEKFDDIWRFITEGTNYLNFKSSIF